jgi:hypothetical protein
VKWNVALPCFELTRTLARCAVGRIELTDGGEAFAGADGDVPPDVAGVPEPPALLADTATVAPDVAGAPKPPALLAVSTTRIVDPTSVSARAYVWRVAPAIE